MGKEIKIQACPRSHPSRLDQRLQRQEKEEKGEQESLDDKDKCGVQSEWNKLQQVHVPAENKENRIGQKNAIRFG